MCLGDCEQGNEQALGNEREEKESDPVHEGECTRKKENVCVRVHRVGCMETACF